MCQIILASFLNFSEAKQLSKVANFGFRKFLSVKKGKFLGTNHLHDFIEVSLRRGLRDLNKVVDYIHEECDISDEIYDYSKKKLYLYVQDRLFEWNLRMLKLVLRSKSVSVFHGTSSDRLDSIVRCNLRSNEEESTPTSATYTNRVNYIYFTLDKDIACKHAKYVANTRNTSAIIIELKMKTCLLVPDLDGKESCYKYYDITGDGLEVSRENIINL
jgi:hypothetical protein